MGDIRKYYTPPAVPLYHSMSTTKQAPVAPPVKLVHAEYLVCNEDPLELLATVATIEKAAPFIMVKQLIEYKSFKDWGTAKSTTHLSNMF